MNLPNQLTVARLVLTAIFVAVLSSSLPFAATVGTILFGIAALTDLFDGILARRLGLITNLGKLMDPLADKILICSTFVILSELDLIPGWAVVVILTREFLVTGLRLVASSQGIILAADSLGKWKTGLQITTAIYYLLYLAAEEGGIFAFMSILYSMKALSPPLLGSILVALTLLITVGSGLSYLVRNRAIFAKETTLSE